MPTPRAQVDTGGDDWLTIHEVGELMGVSVATVRRWSDAGDIESFTTPGGHRRFSRRAVEALLPSLPRQRSLSELGETPERLTRVYRRVLGRMIAGTPWADALVGPTADGYREHGQRISSALLAYLDAETHAERTATLAVAETTCREYGSMAVDLGAGLGDTVELFIRMRAVFRREITSLARRRGLDTAGAMELVESTERAFDQLLRAVIDGHQGREASPIAASLAEQERVPAARERGPR